jgi:membrane-associated phospholipid phosphatase
MVTRRLLTLAAASVAVAVVFYLLLVCTPVGQQLGDDILEDRLRLDRRLRVSTQTALMLLTARSLLVLSLAVGVVALLRRRWRLALGVVIVVLGSAVMAQVLKAVLPRPDFGIDPPAESANSLPSGHASIAMALALAIVMVVPVAWRPGAAVLGGAGAAFVSVGTIVAGWHRPSDVLVADLLAVTMASVVCVALVTWRGGVPPNVGPGAETPPGPRRGWWPVLAAAVILPLVAAPVLVSVVPGGPDVWRAGVDVAVGVAAAAVAAVAVVTLFVRTLGKTELDPPAMEATTT